jgi:PP-loop superfamily ATP-utilizing enzyme
MSFNEKNALTLDQKIEKLADLLRGYGSLLVAFSGGVDC